jgi:predicted LPLAT superfamily acyltransferase
MYQAHAPKINTLINSLNRKAFAGVIELVPGDMDGIFRLKDALEKGEIIAILGDRFPPCGKQRAEYAKFLGESALFPKNVWIIAGLLGCPVYLAFALRSGCRRYCVILEKLTEKINLSRENRDQDIQPYLARYVRKIEDICCQYPYQWFNFYHFWEGDVDEDKSHACR